jgi:hypothetical protein
MWKLRAILLSLLVAVPLCALGDADPVNPAGHLRGNKNGNYTLKVVGAYCGKGTSTVSATSVSISVDLTAPDGCVCSTCFNDMLLVKDRFQGTGDFCGTALTISGRIDMPAGTDAEQTPTQAITGRVTAVFIDPTGKGGRLVAIEDDASRGYVAANP